MEHTSTRFLNMRIPVSYYKCSYAATKILNPFANVMDKKILNLPSWRYTCNIRLRL